jgi:hypothetical protein
METKELHKSNEFLTRLIGFDDQLSHVNIQNLSPASKARFIVNQADWGAVATISTRKDIQSFPVVNLISIADGPVGNGTGIPYMYLTPFDYVAQDLSKDHRATLMVTLAQGHYCIRNEYDPMDPRCARVMLTGKIKALKNKTEEHDIAEHLFFDRHPKLTNMPASHNFFFAKLNISEISMLDNFGGHKNIPVEDYLNTPIFSRARRSVRYRYRYGTRYRSGPRITLPYAAKPV